MADFLIDHPVIGSLLLTIAVLVFLLICLVVGGGIHPAAGLVLFAFGFLWFGLYCVCA